MHCRQATNQRAGKSLACPDLDDLSAGLNGQSYTAGTDRASGQCVDGVCCESSCTGTCQSCNVTGKVGTCSNVLVNVTDGSCSGLYACDGAGSCLLTSGESCSDSSKCVSGSCAPSGFPPAFKCK